ncbi:MAG: PAS domain-containing protein, partial [Alphaproteobacteria bacterium]|nr:PAS domain-containing protein [Alphaproteobacteria bacterium]
LLDDIKTQECRAFALAWQGWRGAELVPTRADVRIPEIVRLLPFVSVLEIISPEVANFRLFGTALYDALGVDLTGLNYFDMTKPEKRDLRIQRTCQLSAHPCGSHYLHSIAYKSGRTVPTEVLSLPVRPNDPSSGPQQFSIAIPMEDIRMAGTAVEPKRLPVSESFQFVDIGAGVPDASLNLANRPPATI